MKTHATESIGVRLRPPALQQAERARRLARELIGDPIGQKLLQLADQLESEAAHDAHDVQTRRAA